MLHFTKKVVAYRFYVKRAFRVCFGVYLNDELVKIQEIARENGFSDKFNSKLIYDYESRN